MINPRPVHVPRADYLLWAKRRPHPANDLGRSDVVACTLDDLPGAREALELTGRNDEGWEPLVEKVAAHHGVGGHGWEGYPSGHHWRTWRNWQTHQV